MRKRCLRFIIYLRIRKWESGVWGAKKAHYFLGKRSQKSKRFRLFLNSFIIILLTSCPILDLSCQYLQNQVKESCFRTSRGEWKAFSRAWIGKRARETSGILFYTSPKAICSSFSFFLPSFSFSLFPFCFDKCWQSSSQLDGLKETVRQFMTSSANLEKENKELKLKAQELERQNLMMKEHLEEAKKNEQSPENLELLANTEKELKETIALVKELEEKLNSEKEVHLFDWCKPYLFYH